MKALQHDGFGGYREIEVATPTVGRALVDFGSGVGKSDTRTVITGQTGITASSVASATILPEDTATHWADEHWAEEIDVFAGAIVPGVGFTIYARTRNVALRGAYRVAWQWS